MNSLWKIPNVSLETPLFLLKEQARLLSEQTKGLLQGEVRSNVAGDGRLMISLYVLVPALNNYRYKVLDVLQAPALFPGTIWSGSVDSGGEFDNLEEFRNRLQEVLSNSDLEKILGGLLSQATSASAA